jgi:hypothetical protein
MITLNRNAVSVWVACIGFLARTNWIVTDYSTLSVGTAYSRTRIFTLLVDASQIRWAIAVTNTFGSAVWYSTDHTILTSTLGLVSYNLALGIRT